MALSYCLCIYCLVYKNGNTCNTLNSRSLHSLIRMTRTVDVFFTTSRLLKYVTLFDLQLLWFLCQNVRFRSKTSWCGSSVNPLSTMLVGDWISESLVLRLLLLPRHFQCSHYLAWCHQLVRPTSLCTNVRKTVLLLACQILDFPPQLAEVKLKSSMLSIKLSETEDPIID